MTGIRYKRAWMSLFIVMLTAPFVQAQNYKANVLACFENLFTRDNFDSAYYRHNHEQRDRFFVIRNGRAEELLEEFLAEQDFLYLSNGGVLSIESKGRLFIYGIRHFVRFMSIISRKGEFLITLQELEFDVFKDKILTEREFRFLVKEGKWSKVSNRKLMTK